jgi:hypothetical protein
MPQVLIQPVGFKCPNGIYDASEVTAINTRRRKPSNAAVGLPDGAARSDYLHHQGMSLLNGRVPSKCPPRT